MYLALVASPHTLCCAEVDPSLGQFSALRTGLRKLYAESELPLQYVPRCEESGRVALLRKRK